MVTKVSVSLETKQRCILFRSQVGYIARAHVRTPFSYLGNGWTDCVEIWYVVGDPLAKRFTEVNGGVQMHVRTCAPPFRILGTAGRIALKFGVWLGDH